MIALAEKIACAVAEHGMIVESCAEEMDLEQIGICHGSCIDRELIEKLTRKGLSGKKDKNQSAGRLRQRIPYQTEREVWLLFPGGFSRIGLKGWLRIDVGCGGRLWMVKYMKAI